MAIPMRPMPMPAPTDEKMLDMVRTGMGGGGFQVSGDLETDKQALIDLYKQGDPNDPNTQQEWQQAKDEFVSEYGEDELPEEVTEIESGGSTDAENQADDTRGR